MPLIHPIIQYAAERWGSEPADDSGISRFANLTRVRDARDQRPALAAGAALRVKHSRRRRSSPISFENTKILRSASAAERGRRRRAERSFRLGIEGIASPSSKANEIAFVYSS